MHILLSLILLITVVIPGYAARTLEIAAWGGEIPASLIQKFEKESGIKVYLSTFESNENLIIKLKSSKNHSYDLITPSGYYVHRLAQFDMLLPIDPNKIEQLNQINPLFLPKQKTGFYGVPFIWGATGIFYNDQYITNPPQHWHDLWAPQYKNQLLLLDDTREVFSMSLLSLKRSPNTFEPKDIKDAYEALIKLAPNIKIFASDAIPRIVSDEDAWIGMAWNGDVFRIRHENPHIRFVYPDEGFIIWDECFSISKNALHVREAYEFINFILRPENAAEITKQMKFSVTNKNAIKFLPQEFLSDPTLYPSDEILKHAVLQEDADEKIISMYNTFWEQIKLSL